MTFQTIKIEAEYTPSQIEIFQGNPLIEALPDYFSYTGADINSLLEAAPERPHPDSSFRQRSEWLHRLASKLFIPLVRHYELYSLVSTLIMQGYEKRRPVTSSYVSMLQQAYHEQKQGNKKRVDYGGSISADPMSVSLIGVSGVGKSYALERLLGTLYPQVIHHNSPDLGAVFDQVVYLKTEIPHNGSVKSMCASLISELGRVTGNDYAASISGHMTLERLRIRLESLFNTHLVGLIILDEVQNLLVSRSSKEELFNFIVEFSNTIHVPIIFVGTPKILEIRNQGMRVSRRLGSMGCLQWDRMRLGDSDWNEFIGELWKYNVLPSVTYEIPKEIEQTLYELSQGIPDLLIKLFILAQERTLACAKTIGAQGKPIHLYSKTIRSVYEDYFANVKPMIEVLKSGDRERIVQIEDLMLEPAVFDSAMNKELNTIKELNDSGAYDSGSYTETSSDEMLIKMAENFLKTKNVAMTDDLKKTLQECLANATEEVSIGELVKIALECAGVSNVAQTAQDLKSGEKRKDAEAKNGGSNENLKMTSSELPRIGTI